MVAKYTRVQVNLAAATGTVTRVTCGTYGCNALTNANELYGWGMNTYGLLKSN